MTANTTKEMTTVWLCNSRFLVVRRGGHGGYFTSTALSIHSVLNQHLRKTLLNKSSCCICCPDSACCYCLTNAFFCTSDTIETWLNAYHHVFRILAFTRTEVSVLVNRSIGSCDIPISNITKNDFYMCVMCKVSFTVGRLRKSKVQSASYMSFVSPWGNTLGMCRPGSNQPHLL